MTTAKHDANQDDSPSFSAAMAELEEILRRIEDEETDIDGLAAELGRAARLLELCRAKIRKAEVEVSQIVQSFQEDPAVMEPAEAAAPEPAGREAGEDESRGDDSDDDLPF